MANSVETIINGLAQAQHGVVARRQLRAAGVRSDALRRRVDQGRLIELSPRVLRVAGAPASETSQLSAAMLDAGPDAVLSHWTAAARWGLPGFRLVPVHVVSSRTTKTVSNPIGVLHRPRLLMSGHVVELDGQPVTTPARTLFDLSGSPTISSARLERLVDTALARRLTSTGVLHRMMEDLATRGRPGIVRMRDILDERPSSYVPPESGLEAAFQALATEAGLTGFERQVNVGDGESWIGRVDFLDRERKLIVEVGDGLFHGSVTDQRRDQRRGAALQAEGWRVEVVDGFDVFHRRHELLARLRELRFARRSPGPLAA